MKGIEPLRARRNNVKRFFLKFVLCITAFAAQTVYAEELQLTDYRYENAQPLLDGYSLFNYCDCVPIRDFGNDFDYISKEPESVKITYEAAKKNTGNLDSTNINNDTAPFINIFPVPSEILKPNGTKLYNSNDLAAYYVLETNYFDVNKGRNLFYPQSQNGKQFILYSISKDKTGIIDDGGREIIDFKYGHINGYGKNLYIAGNPKNENDRKTIDLSLLRAADGAELANNDLLTNASIYISEDFKKFALLSLKTAEDNKTFINYTFVDISSGETTERGQLEKDDFYKKYSPDKDIIVKRLQDKNGSIYYEYYSANNTRPISLTEALTKPQPDTKLADEIFVTETDTGHFYELGNYDFLMLDTKDNITSPRLDKSYIFKEKNIGGKKYYALFKELDKNETVQNYIPDEKPSEWALESIENASAQKLLFNNSKCFYKDPITREDFCILAVEAYCKTQGLQIEEYISKYNIAIDFDRYTDTDNVYILLAEKLGIVKGMSETEFAPNDFITRQQAAVMLSNLSKLSGLEENSPRVDFIDTDYFADWAKESIFNVSSIKNNEGIAVMSGTEPNKFSPWMYYTREQAYVTIYRLYDICSK